MIAISYRREDSSAVTGRLFDRLQAEFGRRNVFMDFDSIPFGVDFREKIKVTLEKARVVVAVVGPDWAGQLEGQRRIDDPRDFVRIEVAAALQRGIPVIPVLLNNTTMPDPEQLPEELRPFAFRNALVLDTGVDFHHHADRLISGIHEIVHGRPLRKRKGGGRGLPLAIVVAAALIAGAIWWVMNARRREPGPVVAIATPTPHAVETPPGPTKSSALSPAPVASPAIPPATSGLTPVAPASPLPSSPMHSPAPLITQPPLVLPKTGRDSVSPPADFQRIASRVSNSARTVLNDRFESPDGTVQFAITAIRVGDLPPTVEARLIALPQGEGETLAERTPSRSSSLYHEDITVTGPRGSYSRYFALDISMSTNPDATTRLWEFWVRDERALQRYKENYRRFKSSVKF